MTFGEKLKSARTAKGLTQKELGEIIGAKNSAISNWEKNLNKPDVELLSVICEALEVSANYFIEAKEKGLALSEQEEMYIKKYRSLDTYGKELIDNALDIEYRRCESLINDTLILTTIAARSENDETKIHKGLVKDLSKFKPDNDNIDL